jgi:hypothetical protein
MLRKHSARFNPDHKWYYMSNQEPEEVTLLNIFDSDESVAVRCRNHPSDFQLPPFPFGCPLLMGLYCNDSLTALCC